VAEGLLPRTIEWVGGLDGWVRLIDQTLLPTELKCLECKDVEAIWEAIRSLRVRGAPAIGVAAAMGVVLGVRQARNDRELFENLEKVCSHLAGSRPTAVNLFWALDRMKARAAELRGRPVADILEGLLAEAKAVRDEDAATCRAIGEHGAALIREGAGVLTHCNAGSLATAEFGTALSAMYVAYARGRRFRVYADETRPLLQGARLTAWELSQAGLAVTVICDNMAGDLMRSGRVDVVITGADRIAANGDTANKVGTYSLAVLSAHHGIPFYVAAPRSTFDLSVADGSGIPIEERSADEIRKGFGRLTCPEGAACWNPAFDVTPAELIRGIVTERGVIEPVTPDKIRCFFADGPCNSL
jgi:methylthioribose-1-phosphate isomerase